jgi:hypothetical protein
LYFFCSYLAKRRDRWLDDKVIARRMMKTTDNFILNIIYLKKVCVEKNFDGSERG